MNYEGEKHSEKFESAGRVKVALEKANKDLGPLLFGLTEASPDEEEKLKESLRQAREEIDAFLKE